jgi:CheY-like chemotaxis protein
MPNHKNDAFIILIVDDESKNIQLLGNLLTENHYKVEFATNGQEALDWVEHKPFDLILLDIMMPGMDGYEVCKILKADLRRKHIPIIFLTAKSETEDIVKGFETGASDYVTKPFRKPELLARIKKEVELKRLRGLIPICAGCKNIRSDDGSWKMIEEYITNHSAASFSHGMCPTCMDKFYGDKEWYIEMKKKR